MSAAQKRLKYVATINDGALGEDTDADFEMQYVDIGNVDSAGTIGDLATHRFADAPSRARRRVRDGDVVISTVRTYLQAIAQIRQPPANLIVSTGFAVVRPLPGVFDAQYCKYALREPEFLAEVERRSVGVSYPQINASDLANIPVHLHTTTRQRAIADYLDRETARIDALIAAKERVLALLTEKRRALITRAVTRGLDPTVPLRDSGIPWLGQIPAHWDLWKLGHLALIGNGSTPSRENPDYWRDGTIPWLNSAVVNQDEVLEADQFVTRLAQQECHLPHLKSGTILVGITGQGKTRGRATVLSIDATINQHLAFITPDSSQMNPWFLRWALFGAYEFLRSISDDAGGTKGALTCEQIAALRVPLPDVVEQRAIVNYIAREAGALGAVNEATQRTIGLLKERRVALIAAAVTGQIDVEAAA
ncbi:MAG: restriction endonuclease subunit S [Vicinamibacteria bacterium]